MQILGAVESIQQKRELMLYLDPSVMVIGTDIDPGSIRYGIRYDSFREDICNIPYLSAVVEESVFVSWEQKLLRMKAAMDRDYSMPKLPSISTDTVKKLLWGLVLMPCTVERIPCEDGIPKHFCRVTYELSPERLRTYWSGAESGLKVSFVLHGNSLIQLDVAAENGEDLRQYRITFTENAEEGPLHLQVATLRSGTREETSCYVTTRAGENRYAESWVFFNDFDGKTPSGQFAYTWYPKTGDVQVFSQSEEPISLNLKFEETGIRITSDEWERFLSRIRHERTGFLEHKQISGSVMLRNGVPFSAPECIYLEDWSLEQLFQILATIKSAADVPIF